MSEEQFAAAVAERARRLCAGGWTVRARGVRVEIEADGQRHVFHPAASYRGPGGGPQDAVLNTALRLVALVADSPALQRRLQDFAWAEPRLHFRLEADVHEVAGVAPPLRRAWLPGLGVGCAVADVATHRLVQVSEGLAERWGVPGEAVWAAARRNLAALEAAVRRCSGTSEIFGFCGPEAGPGHAVHVLCPQTMRRAAEACGSRDLLVGLPEAGTALLCALGSPAAGRLRRAVALLHAEADAPLLADPLLWRDGAWSRPCPLLDS